MNTASNLKIVGKKTNIIPRYATLHGELYVAIIGQHIFMTMHNQIPKHGKVRDNLSLVREVNKNGQDISKMEFESQFLKKNTVLEDIVILITYQEILKTI